MQPTRLPLKKIALFIIVMMVTIALFVLFQIFVMKTTLEVGFNQDAVDADTIVTIRQAESNTEVASKTVAGNKARFRLPIGSYSVTAERKDSETIGFSKLKRLEASYLTFDMKKEKAVEKIGSGSLGCDEVLQKQLFSYACTSPSAIIRHDNPADRFVFPAPLNNAVKHQGYSRSYFQGVLARFDNHDTRYFDYIDLATGQRTRLAVPENSPEEYTIISDKHDSSNQRFLLLNNASRQVYAYDNLQDSSPFKINLPDNEQGAPSASYTLSGSRFIVYIGLPDHAADSHEEEEALKKIKASYIYSLDLTQNTGEFANIKLPGDFRSNNIATFGQGLYLVEKMATTEIYRLNGEDLELNYILHAPSSISIGKDGNFLFTKDDALFRYESNLNQALRIFSANTIKLSRTGFSKDGRPVFNGYISGSGNQVLHSYMVTDKEVDGRRWEEFLPYAKSRNLPIVKTDYASNTIKVQLSLRSFTSDRKTGKISYDSAEFEAAKQTVLNSLRKDGIDTNSVQVYFTH